MVLHLSIYVYLYLWIYGFPSSSFFYKNSILNISKTFLKYQLEEIPDL